MFYAKGSMWRFSASILLLPDILEEAIVDIRLELEERLAVLRKETNF